MVVIAGRDSISGDLVVANVTKNGDLILSIPGVSWTLPGDTIECDFSGVTFDVQILKKSGVIQQRIRHTFTDKQKKTMLKTELLTP